MKIKISNFGPIKDFEADLSKDLVMIYGKNNIGKSYAISAVYLLLKHLLNYNDFNAFSHAERELHTKEIDWKMYNTKPLQTALMGETTKIIADILNGLLAQLIEDSFVNTFGEIKGLKNIKSKKPAFIRLTIPDEYSLQFNFGKKITARLTLKKKMTQELIEKEINESDELILQSSKTRDLPIEIRIAVFIVKKNREIIDGFREEIKNLYFLPASRSGLYTGSQSFFPILTELSKSRGYITKTIEIPALAEPIADYILLLSEIRPSTGTRNKFQDIAVLIEEKILNGKVKIDEGKKQLLYSPTGLNLDLQMNLSSSMVSEISPIVALLKYSSGITDPGEQRMRKKTLSQKNHQVSKPFIFIEEPEAHLHPEAQVKLAEIFVGLVKAGAKLIITSHSNYMFNKLNNMVLDKTLDTERYTALVLKDSPEGSVGKEMDLDELGVEDENFVNIAEALYEERAQIIDRLNNTTDDK